jgi:hypothetical protein
MSSRQNWDSPTPSLANECAPPPPPRTKGGGAHSPAGEGVGEYQFRRLEKKLSTLPTLWLIVNSGITSMVNVICDSISPLSMH